MNIVLTNHQRRETAAVLVIGHRGASAVERENSPAAFRRAREMGADGVELDVRLAPDGRLLVHHDALPVDAADREPLTPLDAALDACDGLLVNVELKDDSAPADRQHTAELVDGVLSGLRRRGAVDRWLVSSFAWEAIQSARAAAPEIRTAYLVVGADDGVIGRVVEGGHTALHPHVGAVTPELVAACHRHGLAVNTWTCNDATRIRELADIEVDGVCTDVPDLALDALGRAETREVSRPRPAWGTPA